MSMEHKKLINACIKMEIEEKINIVFLGDGQMHFIGIFSNHSEYEMIKQNIIKIVNRKDLEWIHINSKNIENMKNIVFETIVLCHEEEINDEQKNILNKLCSNCMFIVVNADVFCNIKIKSNKKINCISYGLNQKSTITISSIQEDKAILSIQRNINNLEQKSIEMGEMEIDVKKYKSSQIENILAIFTIYLIYSKSNN